MKTKAMITMLVSVAMILTAPLLALGAPPDGKGPPGGDGGGGGEPPDYGDLIILYRDADGVPIPSVETQVPDPETGLQVDGGLCWQPIAFNLEDTVACPGTCLVTTTNPPTVSVDQYNCAVATGCSGCTQEVDFGRINDARSDDTVFASQLDDVVVNLATADCVSLDPAGRLVTSRVETGLDEYNNVTSTVTSAAIDSPLQNLAIYKQLMLTGTLGTPLPDGASVLDTAARALGAGSGKTGWVGVDLVAYLNQIMGLSDSATTTILDPKICKMYREEVMGNIELVTKCFLNYGATGGAYSYGRTANFGALPDPAYIHATQTGPAEEGWFEVLAPLNVTEPFTATFQIYRGPIFDTVFGGAPAGSNGIYGIDDFAQAADDTRAVIDYMHSWPLPVDYATPVSCDGHSEDVFHYDLSISPESGLQVPKQVVATTEGREFIVTVANAGPDAATGSVKVTAIPAAGGPVLVEGSEGPEEGPFVFEFNDLAAGASFTSGPVIFTIGTPHVGTTITWTATVDADHDVNPGNNTVTATTNVRVTGGGGGE